jgi:hypothetical protein
MGTRPPSAKKGEGASQLMIACQKDGLRPIYSSPMLSTVASWTKILQNYSTAFLVKVIRRAGGLTAAVFIQKPPKTGREKLDATKKQLSKYCIPKYQNFTKDWQIRCFLIIPVQSLEYIYC